MGPNYYKNNFVILTQQFDHIGVNVEIIDDFGILFTYLLYDVEILEYGQDDWNILAVMQLCNITGVFIENLQLNFSRAYKANVLLNDKLMQQIVDVRVPKQEVAQVAYQYINHSFQLHFQNLSSVLENETIVIRASSDNISWLSAQYQLINDCESNLVLYFYNFTDDLGFPINEDQLDKLINASQYIFEVLIPTDEIYQINNSYYQILLDSLPIKLDGDYEYLSKADVEIQNNEISVKAFDIFSMLPDMANFTSYSLMPDKRTEVFCWQRNIFKLNGQFSFAFHKGDCNATNFTEFMNLIKLHELVYFTVVAETKETVVDFSSIKLPLNVVDTIWLSWSDSSIVLESDAPFLPTLMQVYCFGVVENISITNISNSGLKHNIKYQQLKFIRNNTVLNQLQYRMILNASKSYLLIFDHDYQLWIDNWSPDFTSWWILVAVIVPFMLIIIGIGIYVCYRVHRRNRQIEKQDEKQVYTDEEAQHLNPTSTTWV